MKRINNQQTTASGNTSVVASMIGWFSFKNNSRKQNVRKLTQS